MLFITMCIIWFETQNAKFKLTSRNHIHLGGNTEIFLGGSSTMKCDHDCDQALIKSSWGSVSSIYISELMFCLHQDKFLNVKQVKIPSLAALRVAKYMRTVK